MLVSVRSAVTPLGPPQAASSVKNRRLVTLNASGLRMSIPMACSFPGEPVCCTTDHNYSPRGRVRIHTITHRCSPAQSLQCGFHGPFSPAPLPRMADPHALGLSARLPAQLPPDL